MFHRVFAFTQLLAISFDQSTQKAAMFGFDVSGPTTNLTQEHLPSFIGTVKIRSLSNNLFETSDESFEEKKHAIAKLIMSAFKALFLLACVTYATAWNLTWSDEFDGPAGQSPDPSKWGYDIGDGENGWGNEEQEYYTNSTKNSALDGEGHLLITARTDDAAQYQCWYGTCLYTSARLLTYGKFSQAYGRFEASIQIPTGKGTFPAFWMLGDNFYEDGWPNCGEIDIMEDRGSQPSVIFGTIHGPGYSADAGPSANYTNGESLANDYHLYSIEWDADSITWAVDNNVYETRTPADANGNPWVFDHPFFILLDFAVGGIDDGDAGPDTIFPQSMYMDYVRVYQ